MCAVAAGADGVRHRALRGLVRGLHRELRARGAAARRAVGRAAQPQDARRVAAGAYPPTRLINCYQITNKNYSFAASLTHTTNKRKYALHLL